MLTVVFCENEHGVPRVLLEMSAGHLPTSLRALAEVDLQLVQEEFTVQVRQLGHQDAAGTHLGVHLKGRSDGTNMYTVRIVDKPPARSPKPAGSRG